MEFKVLQINVNHSQSAHVLAFQTACELGVPCVCIADPYYYNGKHLAAPGGWTQFHSVSNNCIIAFCKQLNAVLYKSTKFTISIKTKLNNQTTIIASVYIPPREDIESFINDLNAYNYSLFSYLVAGDFNCQGKEWGYDNDDLRGRALMDFLNTNNLRFLNIPSYGPTYWHITMDLSGCPDLTLTTNHLSNNILKWKLLDHHSDSDHRYILTEINLKIK